MEMVITEKEKHLLRELGKRYAEIAASDVQQALRKRIIAHNDLTAGRPLVWIEEVPWHEMDIDGKLKLQCEDGFARDMEWHFRRKLFQHEYFPGDVYFENAYMIGKSCSLTSKGFNIKEERLIIDEKNHINSHGYIDQLADEADVEKFRMQTVTVDPEKDRARKAVAEEILDGVMPVGLRGRILYYAPWDEIAMLRGVTEILFDLADRPEHLHNIMEAYTRNGISVIEQYEALGLLTADDPDIHCTPALASNLPTADYDGGQYRLKDVWFRTMAQMLGDVSPDMHEEFDVQYSKRIADRCGMVYYGCCEPLHNKIEMLVRNYPNLRKIGVSPWANEEMCAEQIGNQFVYARKPNPAMVAMHTDVDALRKETAKTVEICLKYGCPYELVLKDISTVSYKPENLIVWEKTVREVLDSYYA